MSCTFVHIGDGLLFIFTISKRQTDIDTVKVTLPFVTLVMVFFQPSFLSLL